MEEYVIPVAVALLAGLLFCEYKGKVGVGLTVKTFLSLTFVLAAVVQPHPAPIYYYMILGGLVMCLGGDVLLAIPGEKPFLFGLVSFLLGHLFYVAAFFGLSGPGIWAAVGAAGSGIFAAFVFRWLSPHLGSMKGPVFAYMVVITVMVAGALNVMADCSHASTGRWLVLVGALSFYFSDITVARDRFVANKFENRLVGLPLYYAGQFLLAFSVGHIA